MRVRRLVGTALIAAVVAACGKKQAPGVISRERFVAANLAFRSVPDTVDNADSLRAAALRRHRVTAKDLQRFVQAHARNIEYMSLIWREVGDSLQFRYERSMKLTPPGGTRPPVLMSDSELDARAADTVGRRPSRAVVRPPNLPPEMRPPPRGVIPKPRNRPPGMTQQVPPTRKPPGPPPDATKPWVAPGPDTLNHPPRP
jgi:hypothetical protein